jgi:hypothetical protein
MGLFPSSILDTMRPTVTSFIAQYDAGWREAYADDSTRLRPAPAAPDEGEGDEGEAAAARADGASPTDALAMAGGAR